MAKVEIPKDVLAPFWELPPDVDGWSEVDSVYLAIREEIADGKIYAVLYIYYTDGDKESYDVSDDTELIFTLLARTRGECSCR